MNKWAPGAVAMPKGRYVLADPLGRKKFPTSARECENVMNSNATMKVGLHVSKSIWKYICTFVLILIRTNV